MTAVALPLAIPAADTRATPRVLGLDLSLTAPGVAGNGWADTLTPPTRVGVWRRRRNPDEEAAARVAFDHHRVDWILHTLTDLYLTPRPALAVVEGLAFDSHDTDRKNAGLSWMVRHLLWRLDIPYALVPPTVVKQYITGSGAADKGRMVSAVAGLFDWFDGDDNAADATGLMAMGMARLGCPVTPEPPYRAGALAKVPWPEVVA